MKTTNQTVIDNEEPLELTATMRKEFAALLAPMDRSLVNSVTASIGVRRSHRRLLEGLWLGLSPVMAVAIVVLLYVGGAILPRRMSLMVSGGAFIAPNAEVQIEGSTPKAAVDSTTVSSLAATRWAPSFRILLDGDVARRQLLATWLRARHPDVALMLDTAVPGSEVSLILEPDEVPGFAVLMALHGFIGEAPSGLRILPRFSPQSWSRSLGTSSLFICVIP